MHIRARQRSYQYLNIRRKLLRLLNSCLAVILFGLPAVAATAGEIIDGNATVSVPGTESSPWIISDFLILGQAGDGTLNINADGEVHVGSGTSTSYYIRIGDGSIGTINISGNNALLTSSNFLTLGLNGGTGIVNISDGGRAEARVSLVGRLGSNGELTVTGVDSVWQTSENTFIGESGDGTATIADGATATTGAQGIIGGSANGDMTVTDAGSSWTIADALTVGSNGTGVLTVDNNALVAANNVVVGDGAASNGRISLNGGAVLETEQIERGAGSATLDFDGGVLRLTAFQADLFANFSDGDVSLAAGGGTIDTQNNDVTVAAVIDGDGGLTKLGSGILTFTGDNIYTGDTVIDDGELQLGDGGAGGSLQGDVVNNGMLSFNRSNTLTLAGDISGSGNLEQEGAGTTILTGNSSYTGTTYINDGTLQVSDGGVLSGTSYTELGSELVVTGIGSTFSSVGDFIAGRSVGTASIAVDDGGQLITGRSFLGEGSNYATANAIEITVEGAGSVWNTGSFMALGAAAGGSADITIADGGAMTTASGGGITIGRGGNGTVEVTASGSQLLSSNNLLIGSGFNGGAGDGQLTIADGALVTAPTVILADNNTIPGSNGTLTVSGAAGARGVLETASLATGGGTATATFDGGILRASDDSSDFIVSDVGDYVNIDTGGMFIDSSGFDVTASTALSGTGTLTKQGSGSLVLTANNSYGGGTSIDAGTLQIGDGGSSGAITGDIVNDGMLIFNRSDAVDFSDDLSGTGELQQAGTGP